MTESSGWKSESDARLEHIRDALAAAEAERRQIDALLDLHDASLEELLARLAALEATLLRERSLRGTAEAERDAALQLRDEANALKDEALAMRDEALAMRDEAYARRDEALLARDETLIHSAELVDACARDVQGEIDAVRAVLHRTQNSVVWRLKRLIDRVFSR